MKTIEKIADVFSKFAATLAKVLNLQKSYFSENEECLLTQNIFSFQYFIAAIHYFVILRNLDLFSPISPFSFYYTCEKQGYLLPSGHFSSKN